MSDNHWRVYVDTLKHMKEPKNYVELGNAEFSAIGNSYKIHINEWDDPLSVQAFVKYIRFVIEQFHNNIFLLTPGLW